MNSFSHRQHVPAEQTLGLNTAAVPSWVAELSSVITYLRLRASQVPLAPDLVSEAQGQGS